MKYVSVILLSLFLIAFSACKNTKSKNVDGKPIIEFSQIEFDFGTIIQGEKVTHRFYYKNVGDGDLYIKNVIPVCGCTIADYSDKAVQPGEESFIEATFNSDGYFGLNIKDIEIYTNGTPSKIILVLSANVDIKD